jgi:hypothetical protein
MYKKNRGRKSFRPHRESLDDVDAFVPALGHGRAARCADAEDFAEEFMTTATSGEDAFERARDEFVAEELGGPFLEIDERDLAAPWFAADETTSEAFR